MLENMNPEDFAMMTDSEREQKYGPLLKLWNVQNQNTDLDRQMAMAQQLQNGGPKHEYSTALGATLGGLGDVVRAGVGGYKAKQAQKAMQANTQSLQDPKSLEALMSIMGVMRGQKQQPGVATGAEVPGMGGVDPYAYGV